MSKYLRFFVFFALVVVLMPLTISSAQGDDVVTITYSDYWVTQGPAIDEAIELFEEMHPNINVERDVIGGGGYQDALNLAFQGESAPDVFIAPDNDADFFLYADNDWMLDMMQFDDADAFMDSYESETAFVEGSNIVDGALYSALWTISRPWIALFVNTKVYEDAGLTNEDGSLMLPTTWDEMVENSQIIRDETGAYGTAFSMQQSWAASWWLQFCQYSGPFEQISVPGPTFDHRIGEFTWDSSECISKVLNGLVEMRDADLIHPAALSFAVDDEGVRVLFAEHEFAHLVAGEWVITGWEQTNPDFNDFTAVRLPVVIGDEPSTYFGEGPGGRWFAINSATEHPEEAWEFFKFLYGPDFAQIWTAAGNGPLLNTPPPYDQYVDQEAWSYLLIESTEDVRVVPQPVIDNPDISEVQVTLQGPAWDQVLVGIVSGDIADLDAALTDLQQRYTDALEIGLSDAQGAGVDVSIEDYIYEEWDPTQDYVPE